MEKKALESRFVTIDGHQIHYLTNIGEKDENKEGEEQDLTNNDLLIFLHGFPENAHAWKTLVAYLPDEFDVIAPDLPGYYKSEPLSSEESYTVPNLLTRMSTFIETVAKGRRAVLVGHDWGGAIAWPLAAFHAHLFSRLIILNAAHPSTFTELLKCSRAQREKSQYIHQLIDDKAQSTLEKTEFLLLKNMLGEALFSADMEYANTLLSGWNNKHSLKAMLSYYKNMPQRVPKTNAVQKELEDIRVPNIRILLPTLVLWGEKDDAFDVSILEGLPRYVENLTVKRHQTATHWIHREQAVWAAKHISNFIYCE